MTTSMVNIALDGALVNALLASVVELDLCDAESGIIGLSHIWIALGACSLEVSRGIDTRYAVNWKFLDSIGPGEILG